MPSLMSRLVTEDAELSRTWVGGEAEAWVLLNRDGELGACILRLVSERVDFRTWGTTKWDMGPGVALREGVRDRGVPGVPGVIDILRATCKKLRIDYVIDGLAQIGCTPTD
jgi:hypothetical protein